MGGGLLVIPIIGGSDGFPISSGWALLLGVVLVLCGAFFFFVAREISKNLERTSLGDKKK